MLFRSEHVPPGVTSECLITLQPGRCGNYRAPTTFLFVYSRRDLNYRHNNEMDSCKSEEIFGIEAAFLQCNRNRRRMRRLRAYGVVFSFGPEDGECSDYFTTTDSSRRSSQYLGLRQISSMKRQAVLLGFETPCSQACTAFTETPNSMANTAWLA